MTLHTRRALVKAGTVAAAAGALTGPALLDWANAWAQTAPWKPERGAQLALLRYKSFVQSEDDAFVKLIDAFTKATGVRVTISRESMDDAAASVSAEMARRDRRCRLPRQEIRRLRCGQSARWVSRPSSTIWIRSWQ